MAEKRKLAFYIRLSDADEEVKAGTKDESNSITGQRKLLYAYIKRTEEFAGFEVLEYFDDGYSGTMFNNRAEFQRLIQDAELGRFECIIVKDFSRFGRDYLEVGNYLEFVFPAMGMRFISVNDNYDSDRNFGVTGGMDVAYKNLIYQLYSMDYIIVKSSQSGLMQHDAMSWQVLGAFLVKAKKLSAQSRRLNKALSSWINSVDNERREEFVETLFGLLYASGAKNLSDVSADRLRSTREVIRQYAGLDKDSRTLIKNMLLSLTDKISKARFEK